MPDQSPIEHLTRPAFEGTGWTLLRHGWPALLIFAGLVGGLFVLPFGSDSGVDPAAFSLSREAIGDGRWHVLVSHAFIPVNLMSGTLLAYFVFLAGVTAPAVSNPSWMGGWRLPAVFLAAIAASAAVHLIMDLATPLRGPWPAVLAVTAWLKLARRRPIMYSEDTEPGAVSPTKSAVGDGAIVGLILMILLGALQNNQLLPGWRLDLPAWMSLASVVGGGLLGFLAARFGGRIGQRAVRIAHVTVWLLLVAVLGVMMAPKAGALGMLLAAQPWPAWIAAVAVGCVAGVVERLDRLRQA